MLAAPQLYHAQGLKKLLHSIGGASVQVKNLRSYLIANAGWDGIKARHFVITVTGSVWSNDSGTPAVQILAADFPVNARIEIVNQGLICGNGNSSGGALYTNRPVIINNAGSINGGGYNVGGYRSTGVNMDWTSGCECYQCGGTCYPNPGGTGYGYGASYAGSPRTTGAGGDICGDPSCGMGYGYGGTGADAGAGYSVSGNGYVTWVATGTRTGSVS